MIKIEYKLSSIFHVAVTCETLTEADYVLKFLENQISKAPKSIEVHDIDEKIKNKIRETFGPHIMTNICNEED